MATGVLFDVDGTLVDSNYLHVVAWLRAFRAHGVDDVTAARVHRCVGMGAEQFLDTLVGPGRDDLKDAHATEYRALWPELRAFPGAVDLLREVRRRGKAAVLATSATDEEVSALRRALDADDAISAVTSSADVELAKPEPDVFTVAMRKAGLDDAVVVGDTRWDVEAATKAGLRTVGVLSGGISRAELLDAGAVEVYDDVSALLASFDASPLA